MLFHYWQAAGRGLGQEEGARSMGWVDRSDSDSVFLHTTLPYSVWGWVGVAVLDKMPRLDLKENRGERIRDIIPPLPRVCICIFFIFTSPY